MTNKKTKAAIEIGAGLLAAGAAAGYYFFASKSAKKNRKIAAKWANDLKKDAEKKIKVLKNVDKIAVTKVIEQAATAYSCVKDVGKKELTTAVSELKKNWQKLVK